ncbi:MAG: alpha/beta fold hydrolase [Candidatus Hodarchaeales archaeon]
MPYFQSFDGYRVFYHKVGKGQPIVFVHGYLGSARSHWGKQLDDPLLFNNLQLIAPDLRGFGKSNKKVIESHPTRKIIKDIRILLTQEIKLSDKPILVGYSIGAGLILQYSLLWPNSVKGLVLLSPRPFTNGTTRAWSTLSKEKRGGEHKSQISSFVWSVVKVFQRQMAIVHTKSHLRKSKDFLDSISKLNIPILMLYGNKDTVNPKLSFDVLRNHIPQAKVAVFPTDHGISHEHSKIFNKVLLDFSHECRQFK